jgi:hypothetical protein
MPTAQLGITLSIGSVSINKQVNRTADHPNPYEVSLPKGKAGTLSTRTDADTGEATIVGHGLAENDLVDAYWAGGRRYGMAVGSVVGNVVPLDGGAGDDFPIAGTSLVVTKQVVIATRLDGDEAEIFGLSLEYPTRTDGKGHISMLDADDVAVAHFDLLGNQPKVFDIAGGITNPITGNPIVESRASNGSSLEDAVLKIVALEDATP